MPMTIAQNKKKSYKAKTTLCMQGMIHTMVTDGTTEEELAPFINLAYALEDN